MPLPALEYLQHIRDESNYLMASSSGLTKDVFVNNETLKRAFVRSIEIIGEAAKQVPDSIRQLQPSIDWRGIARMRDRLIHGYFGVDYDIVWDVVVNKVPELNDAVNKIIALIATP